MTVGATWNGALQLTVSIRRYRWFYILEHSVLCVAGCTDPAASNYDASATTDDGSCIYPCLDNALYGNV